ncbi:MAG: MlaE family lipid ABC transporter permease subunit [Pseudomonadota bacterium]
MSVEGWLDHQAEAGALAISAGGGWTVAQLAQLDRASQALLAGLPAEAGRARISLGGVQALDTAGAWLLCQIRAGLAERGWKVELTDADQAHEALLAEIHRLEPSPTPPAPALNPALRLVVHLGASTLWACSEARRLLSFYGQTVVTLARLAVRPQRLRVTSLVHHLEQTCLNALPIVGMIAFLIGIVLAYQGADQLRRFGAEVFTVNLLGVTVLREIGILLTAIVVAGRSGSAFTAELGMMKVREEVDALRTMGVDPIEVLVIPRLLALMIALPLLAFFADILALFGGGLMAMLALGIPPGQFVLQLEAAITPSMFWIGIAKAPVFAFLIGLVGCYQGLSVGGSAESVGRLTTQSVVLSIFLVIVADALFSILFSYLGL